MKLHLASWLVCALATADAVGASTWFSKAGEFSRNVPDVDEVFTNTH